jgi:5S rRNA maturation endonuclease (ribonuclease M5)
MQTGRSSEDVLDDFLELWARLRSASLAPGTVVVVEGERDRRSLRRLGLSGPVLLVHRGDSLAGTAHRLLRHSRRVIVLTDWDVEGGHLAHRLKEFLEAEPLSLDLEFRRRFSRILRGELVHVEGLHRWASRLAEQRGASLEHFLEVASGDDPADATE